MKLDTLLREKLGLQNINLSSEIDFKDKNSANGSLQKFKDLRPWEDEVDEFGATDLGLTSIEGSPDRCLVYFSVRRNKGLKSLKGGPTFAARYFAYDCGLTSLEGGPLFCPVLNVANNDLTSLEGIGRKYLKIGEMLIVSHNFNLRSSILGLLLIKELRTVEYHMVSEGAFDVTPYHIIQRDFINKNNHDIMECKEILIGKGYKEYAKL